MLIHTPKRNSAEHRDKMLWKAQQRARQPRNVTLPVNPYAHAAYNARSGRPHEHKREIARRLRAA